MERLSLHIHQLLSGSEAFAVAAIIGHSGSTPRTSGSRMIVRADSSIIGTIGGGLVEARVMAACAGMLDRNRSEILEFTLDQDAKAGMDMICGGNMTVWIRSFVPPFDPELIQVYRSLSGLEASGRKGAVVTRITGGEPSETVLVTEPAAGNSLLPKALLADIADDRFLGPGPARQAYGLEAYMIEPFLPEDSLVIFGAGHVGYQLAQMAVPVGFSTVVIDDRAEFADPERFPCARQVAVIPEFEGIFDRLAADARTYIVILTRGHLYDQVVLEQALATDAAYIGMIGSRRKRDQIYGKLMEKGVAAERLARVHSPIGLAIRAETPAEIAVSILGELIRERARKRDGDRVGNA